MTTLDITNFCKTCHDLSGCKYKWFDVATNINIKNDIMTAIYCTEKIKNILDTKVKPIEFLNYVTKHITDDGFYKCIYNKKTKILEINDFKIEDVEFC